MNNLTCKRCGASGPEAKVQEDPDRGDVPLCLKCSMALDDQDRDERAREQDAYDMTAPSKRLQKFGHMGVKRYGSRHDI